MSYNITNAVFGGNAVLSRAGGATANMVNVTGAKTYTTQNLTYAVGGKLLYKAAVTTQAVPTTDVVTGKAFVAVQKQQACAFIWTIDASGNFGLAQGPLPVSAGTVGTVTNMDSATPGNVVTAPQFPALPDTLTPVAYFIAKISSNYAGTGFIPGSSDNWDATGVVATAVDVIALPAVPQTA